MNLEIPNKIIKQCIDDRELSKDNRKFLNKYVDKWFNEDDTSYVDSERVSLPILKKVDILLKKREKSTLTREEKYLLRQIKLLMEIKDNPEGAIVKSLKGCESAMRHYMKMAKDYIIFEKVRDTMYPYLINNIEYKASQPYSPAHVKISFEYLEFNETKHEDIKIYSNELIGGKSVKNILDANGFYISNESLFKQYRIELDLFNKYRKLVGEQFLGTGYGNVISSWGSGELISLEKEGNKSRLIIDEFEDPNNRTNMSHLGSVEFLGEGDAQEFKIPYHPNLYMFSLVEHDYLKVHVNNIKEYVYNPSVIEKLILPRETKELIDILVDGTKDIMEDIVKGKTGGIIVISTGVPGTGKTLTAEVYSEVVERPLYVVQSSQLGIKIDELERNLKEILSRANRWNAILLIDEADVYVHERGNDLIQNAVVGVFLRVLEYYRGILFMTSNRDTIMDDAIMSRATAHIKYNIPTTSDAKKIWRMLSEQFKIKINEEEVGRCVNEFSVASGRDIKSLLKLAKLMANRKKVPVDFKLIKYVSKFIDINKEMKE